MAAISPREFAAKWSGSKRTERAASQEHFIDLCRMLDVQTPNEADPIGDWYAFEKDAEKSGGDEDGSGFADVWKRKHFAWEYKGKKKNLTTAYNQLLQYREALENPPLLVVCDLNRFEVHTNFTNTAKQVHPFELADLDQDPTEFLRVMRAVMTSPEDLLPDVTPDQLTQQAAEDFSKLANRLREREHEAHDVAQFLNRLVFCLFAEDAGLLPSGLLERIAEGTRLKPEQFAASLRELFAKMSNSGGLFGTERIEWFNGGLFDSDEVLALEAEEIDLLRWVGRLDWSQINPAIFGTLFERGLDPSKRSQLGAHYTDTGSIERVVEPVVIAPLKREFEAMKERVTTLLEKGASPTTIKGKVKTQSKPVREFHTFLERLRAIRVLDPACGSGNFLYVALRSLKDLEREVILWGSQAFGATEFPRIGPHNVLGIELNEYAAELARVTIWIGEIQWMIHNGFSYLRDPILKPLDNIETGDALIRTDDEGTIVEAEWPQAEFAIGNPPFLGSRFFRSELGDDYVKKLSEVFSDRISGEEDFVVYWFEKARAQIDNGGLKRAGLLATQGIRGGSNRKVLDRIKQSGDIFMAWSDLEWTVEGAAVHISIVGFDSGSEVTKTLNGSTVDEINADLTSGIDVTGAARLQENKGIAFQGPVKIGPFDIPPRVAETLLAAPNTDARSNGDVVRPWVNARDITQRPRGMWIIDFGELEMEQAALYEAPFEYVKQHVKPVRDQNRRERRRLKWWQHGETVPGFRRAVHGLQRYLVTPRVSRHRVFVWVPAATVPDSAVVAIARADDYIFGVLHSRFHELWARRKGTQLREVKSGFRYTPRTTYETFPFPHPTEEQTARISAIAAEIDQRRGHWLNPDIGGELLTARALTNLYNNPPTWLQHLHKKLDDAVATAYGWPCDISDAEVLERILALNLDRAETEAEAAQSKLLS